MKIKSLSDVHHLEVRLGFGVLQENIKTLQDKDSSIVLNYYMPLEVDGYTIKPSITPWDDIKPFFAPNISLDKKKVFTDQRSKESNLLKQWWLERIHHNKYPLQERMTLFWHNHFTSSIAQVQWPQLMYQQNQLLRHYSLGSFADLLKDIYKDPSMLIYLNGQQNIKTKPNENFARELLELFALGVGYYTEQDVLSAARAFSGWSYNFREGNTIFNDNNHDNGVKEFLGKMGHFSADDIINIILDQERVSEFITEKMWLNFVSPIPNKEYIKYWAKLFRESNYNILGLLNNIIQSDVFWSEDSRNTLIKSPVELTLGLLRELNFDSFNAYNKLIMLNGQLGQDLFAPPDVKGWREGESWITTSTLALRQDFIAKMLKEHENDKYNVNYLDNMPSNELHSLLLGSTNIPIPTIEGKTPLEVVLYHPAYQLR